MKKVLEVIQNVLERVFGYGMLTMLLVGALSFIGYMIALALGGPIAEGICVFIYKSVYPILITCTSALVLLGLLSMYLKGEEALSAKK